MGVQCKGKKAFKTKRGAEHALNVIWKSSYTDPTKANDYKARPRPCRVYSCVECGKWHMTSQRYQHLKEQV